MFKFTLTLATSAFLFMSGTADLFAMEPPEDADQSSHKALVFTNHIPKEIMQVIFVETSKGTNPRHLMSICNYWYSVIRENNIPEEAELHYSTTHILHTAMNPFMQQCMHTYWDNLFYNGILRYTPVDEDGKVIKGGETVTLKFSDFTDGTFDLSTCGDTGQFLVITESMDRFFTVCGENENKIVVGIMPCHRILQEVKNSPKHPFYTTLRCLYPDKTPAILLFRWGNENNLTRFDDIRTTDAKEISKRNLYENWGSNSFMCNYTKWSCPESKPTKGFHVYF